MNIFKKIPLSDFITLQRGFDLPSARRKVGNIPVVASTGITGYHNEARVQAPGVVIGRSGSIGGGQYLSEDFWPLNTTLWVKDFKGNNPRFTYYLLKSIDFTRFNAGAGVPTLNRNHIASLQVPAYTINTQVRIASILSAYDDLIENNRRRIQLLEQAARLLYKEWFVHLRFPGHEHVKIKDGVPEGWERIPLGDALTLQRGFDLPVKKRKDGPYPIYASTGINGYHEVAKVKGPGVVTGRSGSLGTVMYVSGDFWPLNTTLWVKEFKKITPFFAVHLLSDLHLEQYNGGAAVPTLNRNDVHHIEILCPSITVLDIFNEYVAVFYEQIDILSEQSELLKSARDLLLPRLMNGEIAV